MAPTEDVLLVEKNADDPCQLCNGDLPENHQEALATQTITVKVEHPSYEKAIDVRVSEAATLLDVRKEVAALFGPNQLENVLLREKVGNRSCQLPDTDLLGSRRELLASGGPVLASDEHAKDVGRVPAMSTLELIKEGRAVEHTCGHAILEGEIIRVEAESLNSVTSFFIELLSESGDVVLQWQADTDIEQVACTSSLCSWGLPPLKEIVDVGDAWIYNHPEQRVIIDFELSALKWKVYINGIRIPKLDFAHRAPVDVTQVKISESLTNARVILILRSEHDPPPAEYRAPLKRVRVIHAVYGRSIEVSVPANATLLDVRKTVLKKTKVVASRLEEILLVERVGRTFVQLSDDEALNGHKELLALGCNKAFILPVDSCCSNLSNLLEPSAADTDKLREWGQAEDFTKGYEVRVGDTIRVQADGWSGSASEPTYSNNTFYINLVSDRDDVVLHWGARQDHNQVVRNSRIDGGWGRNGKGFRPPEETVGAWPHGDSQDPLVIDFTRTAFNWKIHVNHVRQPDFDFAHRMPDDVTDVHVSNNLRNPKILLIPSARTETHSRHATSREFQRLASEFQVAQPVKDGETIRVEAQWWDKGYSQAAKTYNAFFIDLKSTTGDLALHWGARPQWRQVVRNSMLDGFWGQEETKGGWPHWPNSSNFFGANASVFGDNVLVDFTRTDQTWLVSVNGQRLPAFDYKHRTNADVTHVAVSDSLCNVKVTLFEATARLPDAASKADKVAEADEAAMPPLPCLLGSSPANASAGGVQPSFGAEADKISAQRPKPLGLDTDLHLKKASHSSRPLVTPLSTPSTTTPLSPMVDTP